MPSVTFSNYASTSWGTMWSDVEIDYTETYNASTNTTRVSISGVYFRVRGDTNFSTQVIRGRVKINGETVCSFSPGSSTATQINVTGSYSKLDNGSGSFYADIAHAADGTGSFTISVDEAEDASISDVFGFWYAPLSHKIGVWGNDVGPQTITLTTHPRISSISVSNGYFGQPISISISRYNSSFTHTVVISCAGDTRNIMIKGSSVSFTWTPPLNDYGPRITNAMSAVATIYCHTYNGDTHIGTSTTTCTLTFRAADVAPSVSIATTDPQGYLATYGRYVKGKSKIKVTLTNTLRYGATLKSVSISANGATYNSSPATTDVIASASNTSVTARITDSRGQTATASATIAIYDYATPQINSFSVHRCNSDGTLNNSGAYMRVDYKVTVTALGNNHPNSKTLTLKYKKASASGYTSQAISLSSYTQTGEVHNIAADVNSSYNVQLVLSDDFASATSELALPTASTRVNWKPGENGGIAFGKVSEYDKTFEVAADWTTRLGGNLIVDGLPGYKDLHIEGRGQNWYIKVATITITGEYVNRPLVFEFVGRGQLYSVVQIVFVSANNTDPGIFSFTSSNNRDFYIRKTATSTWELIAKYSEPWGDIRLCRYFTADNPSAKATISLTNIGTSMPSGLIQCVSELLNVVYPVGSIYMSVNSTSPATLFGGTWERIQDRFLLAAGSTYVAGNTGGEATHTLTVGEIPSHNHPYAYNGQLSNIGTEAFRLVANDRTNNYTGTPNGYTGGGQAHNNMPPYLTVYMWKRTA